ncbi:MAG: hypothetical protein GF329_10805 [Candidatus Lokiarchaeota archaeon]|nr:hypothetical protein [Candidatus Lokiarchaeota archaeon]
MINQEYYSECELLDDAPREVVIREIEDNMLLDTILCLELRSKLLFHLLDKLKNRFKVMTFALEMDGISFRHAVCFHGKIDNIVLFGHFGTYGQIPQLNVLLLEKMTSYGEKLGARFIVGPINLLSSDQEMGFHKRLHEDYIVSCEGAGFTVLQKRNLSVLLIKHLPKIG